MPPPEFLPETINKVFKEGASCLSISCWNAAGTMFRQCLDIATKSLIPEDGVENLKSSQRNNLGPRIKWLIEEKRIPKELEELATCIRQDGNDGAHDGTLGETDAMDLLDFTVHLLECLYTRHKN